MADGRLDRCRLHVLAMRTLITNACLVHGGADQVREWGELLIEEDRIAGVGCLNGLPSPDRVVDAKGAIVAPGFIDVHSHGDFVLPSEPEAEPKVRQGITTEIVGNCGLGLCPANEKVQAMYRQYGRLYGDDGNLDCSSSLSAYRERLETMGVSVNVACLVPHGNLRCAAMGLDERCASPHEMAHMQELLEREMADGAVGVSTGLVYPPGAFADTEELIGLAQTASRHGGLYASHVRDEGSRLEASIAEALEIGEQAHLPVQISHHKAAGKANWGKVKRSLAQLAEARGRGLNVHSDMYPYTAGSTMLASLLLPLWVFAADSPQESLDRLRDPKLRGKIIQGMRDRIASLIVLPGMLDQIPKGPILPLAVRKMSDMVTVSSTKRQKHYEGRTLREVAAARGQSLYEAMLDFLAEEDAAVTVNVHLMQEADVRTVLSDPFTMVGTDGMPSLDGKPHPRGYGTYPRIIEHYVGRLGLFELEAAVHKMTGLPAQKFGLSDRGVLEAGKLADVVMFRPEAVRDRATYTNPRQFPEGIDAVWVRGQAVVQDGAHTGARPGRVWRGQVFPS